MNKFELEKTMEHFGHTKRVFYSIYDLRIYHNNYHSAIVEGFIPLDLATLIYEKYDSDKYGIKIDHKRMGKPVSDVNRYFVDKVEGLAAIILEVSHHYYGVQSSEADLNYALNDINERMLYSVDTSMPDSMRRLDNRKEKNKDVQIIRDKIKEFDEGFYPFDGLNIDEYISNYDVRGFSPRHYYLIDKKTNVEFRAIKTYDGFINKLHYNEEETYETSFIHKLTKEGEFLVYYQNNKYGLTTFEYDINHNIFTYNTSEPRHLTPEDKELLINVLNSMLYFIEEVKDKNVVSKEKNNTIKLI